MEKSNKNSAFLHHRGRLHCLKRNITDFVPLRRSLLLLVDAVSEVSLKRSVLTAVRNDSHQSGEYVPIPVEQYGPQCLLGCLHPACGVSQWLR